MPNSTFHIGYTLARDADPYLYADMAVWCNANNAMIATTEDGYTITSLPSPSEEEVARDRIATLKEYLAESDYIVTKMTEYSLLGKDISAVIEEYSTTLAMRDEARDEINEIYAKYPRLALGGQV